MIGSANGLVTWSELHVPSGLAALLIATVPFWMTLLDWIAFGGPRPTRFVVLGILCGFAGVALLMAPGEEGSIDPAGGLALLGATLCWSTGTLYSRRAELPRSPLLAAAMEMVAGGVTLTLVGSLVGEWPELDLSRATATSYFALLYLSLFGSLVAFAAYVWLNLRTSPALISTYAFVNPVVAVFLGYLVLDEPLHTRVLSATALIVGAVVAIQYARFRALRGAEPRRRERDRDRDRDLRKAS
jgi:drug/metabolite transporter (DMT)-like permease